MNLETVRQMWQSFEAAVMPVDAPAVQRQEMRRAFYAGAHAMLQTVKQVGEDDVTEDAGVVLLEALERELTAFTRDMLLGRA